MPVRNFIRGGGKEKLNSSQDVQIVAKNQIFIGDTVYTITNEDSQFSDFLSGYVQSVAFSPGGTKLVLGGYFTGRAKIYDTNWLIPPTVYKHEVLGWSSINPPRSATCIGYSRKNIQEGSEGQVTVIATVS